MQSVETEVKIRVDDKERLEQSLQQLGFCRKTPRLFERNTLYDTPDRRVRRGRQILRLRQYGGRWVLTHKQAPPDDSPADRHKRRIETETALEDGEAMARIFVALGFHPSFVYEKWRTEWRDGDGVCEVDETPIGLYAELEGPPDWIDATLARLGVSPDRVTTLSYGRLFEAWQRETGGTAQNMAFAEITPAETTFMPQGASSW